MGKLVHGIAAFVGCGVGLGVLATGPVGSPWGALALREHSGGLRVIDGNLHYADPRHPQIRASRAVSATPEECWRLWTTEEGLRSFLGRDSNVSLEIGGPYEVYFRIDNARGRRGSEGCKVLSYLPERMLSFEWNAPPHFPLVRARRTRVVVLFEPAPEGTVVELVHLGFGEGDEWAKAHEYFTLAWPRVMDRFAAAANG